MLHAIMDQSQSIRHSRCRCWIET